MAHRKKIKVEDQESLISALRAPGRLRNSETIGLALRVDDRIPTILEALDAVQRYPESRIENFEIDLEILCNDEIRVRLGQIFEVLNKRSTSWSVLLKKAYSNYKRSDRHPSVWVDVDYVEKSKLQSALSVLKSVRHLALYHQRCLECLPKFDHLESLDLRGTVVPFNVDTVYRYPFAAQVIGVDLSGHFLYKPVFAHDIRANVRDMQVNMTCSLIQTQALVSEIITLHALEKLKIVLPIDMEEYDEPINHLFYYLTCPQSKVSHLSFAFGSDLFWQFPRVMAMIRKMSQLKILEVIFPDSHYENSLTDYFDILIQTVRDMPSIDTIFVSTPEVIEKLIQAIFDFQMECRPRRLMAQIFEGGELYGNKTHHASLVYETLENFDRIGDPQSFPLSSWPRVLQKLGYASGKERMYYFLRDEEEELDERVKVFGLDAVYSAIHRLLEDPLRILTSKASDEQIMSRDTPCRIEGDEGIPTKKQKLV